MQTDVSFDRSWLYIFKYLSVQAFRPKYDVQQHVKHTFISYVFTVIS
jgi:hypothetical protein